MDRSGLPRLGFIGTGVVAMALSQALASAGYPVVAVHGRTVDKAKKLARAIPRAHVAPSRQTVVDQSDLIILAVPDDAIASVAESVSWGPGRAAVHCDGAASVDLLLGPREAGADVGVFHPLQSFATPEQACRLMPGSAFRIEASSPALRTQLEEMARAVGGRPFSLRGDPTLYHASAVLASNCLVALLDLASGLWPEAGGSREQGLEALLPLVRGTIENLERVGLPAALTGPIARGDMGTVVRHLSALGQVAPHVLPVYKELGLRAVQLALTKGTIDRDAARRLRDVLAGWGKEAGCE